MVSPESLSAAEEKGRGRFLFERLREEVARASRFGLPLACVLFRVRGPRGTDDALRDRLARAGAVVSRRMVRDSDVVAFLGDGQFGVLANASREGARTLAHAVARELEGLEFTHEGRGLKLEVDFGISTLGDGKTAQSLLEEARAALDLPYATHQVSGYS